jgi:hypothetical protein
VAPNVECADGKVDVERQAGHRAIRTDASHPSGKALAPRRILAAGVLGIIPNLLDVIWIQLADSTPSLLLTIPLRLPIIKVTLQSVPK